MRAAAGLLVVLAVGSVACSQGARAPVAPQQPMGAMAGPPVNVATARSLQGQVACPPKEVAPGVWAGFDCGAHAPVTHAIAPMFKRSFVAGPLPPFVDHRITALEGPVKNQGAVGACTALSLSTAMDHAIRKMGRPDVISALHVWSKYAVSSMGVAGDRTEGERIALDGSWPYDAAKACRMLREPLDSCGKVYGVSSGTGDLDGQLRAERSAADGAGRYTISAIEKLQSQPADLDEMSAVLAGGDAIWASFWVDSDAWSSRNLQPGAVIPDYERTDDSGHAVELAGYRVVGAHKQFLVHNSWGRSWGDGGYGWLSDTMVLKHLRAAYKVRVTDGSGPNPGPNPGPGGNGGCPAGQAPDSVLGSCAALCSSGSAPAAGVCLPSIPGMPQGGLPAIPGMPAPGSLPFPIPLPLPGVQPGQPAPQGGSCGQGQVKDAVTGQCANACPGGAAPMGGLCLPELPH